MIKFAALAIIFTVLPLAYLIWNWQQLHSVIKTLLITYLIVVLASLYPVTSFLVSMTRVEQVFPEDCDSALRLSYDQMADGYSKASIILLKGLLGFTPNYYFQSTTAICELKKQNFEAAIAAFERALADSDAVDIENRRKLEEGLKKAKSRAK